MAKKKRSAATVEPVATPRSLEENREADGPKSSEELYPNYKTTIVWVSFQMTACIFLFLLWAPNPTKATAIVAAGTDYIGAFRKCSGTTCQDWLKGGSTSTSSSSASTDDKAATTTRRDLLRRAGTVNDAVNTTTFFLNTGMAFLSAFYFSLYITIFLIIRRVCRIPEPPEPEEPPDSETDPATAPKKPKHRWRNFKVFGYRAGRSLAVLNVILIFGCLIACGKSVWDVRSQMKLSGSDGIGGGLFFLLLSLLLSLYSCVRDLAKPYGRSQKWAVLRCWFPNKLFCITRKPWEPANPAGSSPEMGELPPVGGGRAPERNSGDGGSMGRGSGGGSSGGGGSRLTPPRKPSRTLDPTGPQRHRGQGRSPPPNRF